MHLLQNIVVLLIASFPICMYAYSNGQVTASCDNMTPQHGASAQTSSPPYTLSLDKYTYSAGDKIKVTLSSSSSGTQFKGFLLQGRSGSSNVPVGSFVTSNPNTQTLTCTNPASSVSHTSSSGKTSIDVTWVAPSSSMTNVQIRATVVQSAMVFWTNVVSANVAYVPVNSTPTTTVGNVSPANTTVGNSSTINTTLKTDLSTSTVKVTPTTKQSSPNTGVQSTWTLEALLLSCVVLITSLLA
ncbi:defense protein l(2)34Fc-like [Leptodactylus fuscus]